MKLLKLENNHLCSITPEALGLKAFRDIWERDKTKNKDRAKLDLSFVYFFADWQSTFKKLPVEDKITTLEKEVYDNKYKADTLVLAAAKMYEDIQNESSFSLKHLESVENTAAKISEYLAKVKLDERDKQGKAVYNVNQLQKTIADFPETIKKITEMRKHVEVELTQDPNLRGGAHKSSFED
jgi:hypothetical protein